MKSITLLITTVAFAIFFQNALLANKIAPYIGDHSQSINYQSILPGVKTARLLDSTVFETTNGIYSKSKTCYTYDDYGFKVSVSRYKHIYSGGSYNWEETSREDYNYDEIGNVTSRTTPDFKEVYEYNNSNQVTRTTNYSYIQESQEWLKNSMTVFFYSDSVYMDSIWSNSWDNWHSKTIIKYNQFGKEVKRLNYSLDTLSNSFKLYEQADYNYDQNNIISIVHSSFSAKTFKMEEIHKKIQIYDTNDRLIKEILYAKNSLNNDWDAYSMDSIEFNIDSLTEIITNYSKDYLIHSYVGDLKIWRRRVNKYNTMGLISSTIFSVRETYYPYNLINDRRVVYAYDEFGSVTNIDSYEWHSNSNQWLLKQFSRYYYSTRTIQDVITEKNDITIIKSGRGSIKFSNQFRFTGDIIQLHKDSSFTISLLPDDGFMISLVSIEGVDYTNQVENGYVTIPKIHSDAILRVEFKEIIYKLSIYFPNIGKLIFSVKYNQVFNAVQVWPEAGWELEAVIFNDIDVTLNLTNNTFDFPLLCKDSELRIIYSQINSINNSHINNAKIKIYTLDKSIFLEGVPTNEDVYLFSLDGVLIQKRVSGGDLLQFDVERNGIYLIKTNQKTYKLIL